MQCGIWPSEASSSTRTQQYWQHLRDVKSPVAGMSQSGDHVPIYLWGDGAQYTESGQSIMVLACGLVMDDERTNIFPLCLCREDPWMQPVCISCNVHAATSLVRIQSSVVEHSFQEQMANKTFDTFLDHAPWWQNPSCQSTNMSCVQSLLSIIAPLNGVGLAVFC